MYTNYKLESKTLRLCSYTGIRWANNFSWMIVSGKRQYKLNLPWTGVIKPRTCEWPIWLGRTPELYPVEGSHETEDTTKIFWQEDWPWTDDVLGFISCYQEL